MEVDSSYSYHACRGHVGTLCAMSQSVGKVERPRTGLQPPYGNSWKSGPSGYAREVGCVYTLTQLLADQQTLRKAPKPLVTPVVPLKACWLNRTEMSCYFSHLSAVTDRGEFDESLIPGFPPFLGVGTVDICCEQPTGMSSNA